MDELPAEQLELIMDALFNGRKIEAIKIYRESTGKGLKESKEAMDALERDLRTTSPEKFTQAEAAGSGCAKMVLLLVSAGAALVASNFV
jgi:ribosomal protein L7/L12